MSALIGRSTARIVLRAFSIAMLAAFLFLTNFAAHAVVVRGIVTDALGAPIPAARVQLIQGPKSVASATAGPDGGYEIRFGGAGRFVILTSAATFEPGIGQNFYGGSTDVLTANIVLEVASVHEYVTVTATGIPTPIAQTSSAVTLIPERDLATTIGIVDALRQSAGVTMVQTGQSGGATSLFVRGGNSDANKVLIDGVAAEDVGGRFDFGTVSSTAIGAVGPSSTAMELYRGPDSVLYGSDAASSVVSFGTPRGIATRSVLNYSGDAGSFHSYRDEVTLSGTRQKLDYYTAFSRFDTSNALPMDEYHAATSAANLGYDFAANTHARFTIRNSDSATGAPNAHDFFGISAAAKQNDQDIYSGLTIDNRLQSGWHNLARYGIARKREQFTTFYPVGQLVTDIFGDKTYYGKKVTIRGANGYAATGQAAIAYGGSYPAKDDSDSNRDELYYQTDYVFPHRIAALFGFRYERERGSFVYPAYLENEVIQRRNFEYTLQFSGDIKRRVFYSAGGAVEKNHLYGVAGTPRLGVAYAPVRPQTKWMHGTRLRANAATGVQEPSLAVDFSSLFTQLETAPGGLAAINAYNVTPIRALHTRTYDFGVDQNIRGEKLVLKIGYFRNQFSHQIEYVGSGTLKKYFGITGNIPNFYGADLNSLAFRAQGAETELQWQPTARVFVRGGYTYLDAIVEQSFSSDAVAAQGGYASMNPNIPGIAIGESPFIGARPFRRPPHTGFFAVQYIGTKFNAAFKGAMASRSDDSTYLDYSDLAGTDSMILPNRDLDFGYAKLDAGLSYAVKPRFTVFSQLDNLLGQQHIGPIGYPGLPFTVRAGLKVRIGGD